MDRYCGVCLLGIAILGVSEPALAADVPGSSKTRAVMVPFLKGTTDFATDSDWYRVALMANQNYAFRVNGDGWITIRLRDANGKGIRRATAAAKSSDAGFEFRPTHDGLYFVEFKDVAIKNTGVSYPYKYYAAVAYDARRDISTSASIDVNGDLVQARTDWGHDVDYYRATLDATKTYTLTMSACYRSVNLKVVNASNQQLFGAAGNGSCAALTTIAGFHVPATGTYYVVVAGNDNYGAAYTLALTTP